MKNMQIIQTCMKSNYELKYYHVQLHMPHRPTIRWRFYICLQIKYFKAEIFLKKFFF